MPDPPVPWIGLAALLAMFVLPLLPDWLFEGPRTIRHRSRHHICTDCGAAWTRSHVCQVGRADRYDHDRVPGTLTRLDEDQIRAIEGRR